MTNPISYLLGSPFTVGISHVLRRLNGWYVFQNAIAESDDRYDGASDYSYDRLVK